MKFSDNFAGCKVRAAQPIAQSFCGNSAGYVVCNKVTTPSFVATVLLGYVIR